VTTIKGLEIKRESQTYTGYAHCEAEKEGRPLKELHSFLMPVHKLAGYFLSRLLVKRSLAQNMTIKQVLATYLVDSEAQETCQALISGPVRMQGFMAEVSSGKWKLNGLVTEQLVVIYLYINSHFNMDMALI
jgi:hypothetical protein